MPLFRKPEEKKAVEMPPEEVLQAFRQACWDLYVSNLPDPKVVDTDDRKAAKEVSLPEDVPRGFSIDPRTWVISFNTGDMPSDLPTLEDRVRLARSIFHHEITHFTQVPADGVTEAVLVDAALKGFRDPAIADNPEMAKGCAYVAINFLGDLIGDTMLAKSNYGREDFNDLTVWRTRTIAAEAAKAAKAAGGQPSLLWQALVTAYERMWDEDLGIDAVVKKRDPKAVAAAEQMVKAIGADYRDRSTWEGKTRRFAEILEPLIKLEGKSGKGKSGKGGKGGGSSGMSVPEDLRRQMGNPTESPTGKAGGESQEDKKAGGSGEGEGGKENPADSMDDRVLEAVYERNKKSPGSFAGTMGALAGVEPDDALRLMYRARARELLVSLAEKENQRAERIPSYRTTWNVGDPVMGRGGLEVIPSVMASGRPVPGITTYKRKLDAATGHGRLKMIPDLVLLIDSSGSMNWDPQADNPDSRGNFDKAILAAEAAALYALDNGGKVAAVNFSGPAQVRSVAYTADINEVERVLMHCFQEGTVFPVEKAKQLIRRATNPLLTCVMSDCQLSNPDEAVSALSGAVNEHDSAAVFWIGGSSGYGAGSFVEQMRSNGALIYPVARIEDLAGMIIGEVKRTYDTRGENDDHDGT